VLYTARAFRVKLGGLVRSGNSMLWKLALYLLVAWGIVCTVLTVTYFGRVGLNELRRWLRDPAGAGTNLIPAVDQSRVITMQRSRRRPG
jgi:hypothetical protein